MHPEPIFLNVNLYGICIAVGLLLAFGVLYVYSRMKRIDDSITDFIFYDGVASIVAGFGFASLFQSLYDFIENPSQGFKLGTGITFLGGFLGGAGVFIAVYFIFRKRLKARLIDSISVIPCCILIGHALGRLGCFFAGCCYGKPSEKFGIYFKELGQKVLPTQLYEAIFLFIAFAVCSFLWIRYNFKYNLCVYFISYGLFRFIVEFFRDDDRGKLFKLLSPSQFWAVIMVIAGIILIFALKPLFAKREKELALLKEKSTINIDEKT